MSHGGKIGVLVDFTGADSVGKDLAMHIAATKPKALNAAGVSAADIATERSRGRAEEPLNRASPPTSSPRWSKVRCRSS